MLEPTDKIVLNAVDMTFANAVLNPRDGKVAASRRSASTPTAQTATLHLRRSRCPPGRYTLSIDYTGKIGTQANGLFAIDYDNKAGKQRALFTQFEASDARRFMPSWDEPDYKATFDLTADRAGQRRWRSATCRSPTRRTSATA